MDGHHLILGRLRDFLTNQWRDDTHDERYRQRIARLLVNEKGYARSDIIAREPVCAQADDKRALVPVDFVIHIADRTRMVVKYGPGSLTTRHKPALAICRLLVPYQIPVAVVTNGEDAEILDAATGRMLRRGLAAIPSRRQLMTETGAFKFSAISSRQSELAARILYAYEIDGACPCDTTVCRLPANGTAESHAT